MKKLILLLFCFAALSFGFQATKDTDFGWHYQCGKELLSGHPCLKNNYSYFLPDYKAYYPSFVYDTVLAISYDHFGFAGLSVLNSLILLLSMILLYKLIKGPFWLQITLPLLILFTPGPSLKLGLRPQVFTFLFFLLVLKIGDLSLKNYKYLYFLPLLFTLWVNTHIGFVSGILLLPGLYLNHPLRKKWFVILPFTLAFLATLFNPFGTKVHLELYRHLEAPLSTTIAEWVAPPLWLKGLIFFLVFELTLLLASKKLLNLSSLINLFIFTVLAYLGYRNLIFLSTLMVIYLSRVLNNKYWLDNRYTILITLICLFIFSKNLNITPHFNNNWNNYCVGGQVIYPCEFIKKFPNLKGNVFATYEWGGFLIWKLPNIKVFADGRTPAWLDENGKSTYEVYLAILQTQPGWNEKLTKTGTDYILISPGTFLDLLLHPNPEKYNWRELYRDKTTVLYTKTNL